MEIANKTKKKTKKFQKQLTLDLKSALFPTTTMDEFKAPQRPISRIQLSVLKNNESKTY